MILVIGLSGRIGAGKGTVAEYLKKKYKAEQFVYSDILRDILESLHMKVTRENLQALGKGLRDSLGKDVLVNAMKGELEDAKGEMRLIDGVRYVNEVQMLKTFPHNVLIFVDAPLEVRYERAKKRAEKGEEKLSLAEFKEREKAATEGEISKVEKLADYKINNSGSLDDFYKKIDELMKVRK
jgi:dephospho-CoA kinase